MERKHTVIYDSAKESLINRWSQIQALRDEGINVGSLEDDVYRGLELLEEIEDARKLEQLRKELHDKIIKEEWQKNRWGN